MSTLQASRSESKFSTVDEARYRSVAGCFASGVSVITTRHGERNYGTTVSAVSSLSMTPPMMLICLNTSSQTHDMVQEAGGFAVNILAEEQGDLAYKFARKGEDKFDGVQFHYDNEIPVLNGTLASVVCRTVETVRGGTHTVFLAEVVGGEESEASPLTYFQGKFGRFAQ